MSPLGSRALAVLAAVVAAGSVGIVAIFVGGDDELRPGSHPASIDAGGRRFEKDGTPGDGNGEGRGDTQSGGGDVSTESPLVTVPTIPAVSVPTLPLVTTTIPPTVPTVCSPPLPLVPTTICL